MGTLKSITGRAIKDSTLNEFIESLELEPGNRLGHVFVIRYVRRQNGKGGFAHMAVMARTEVRTLNGSRVQKYRVIGPKMARIALKKYPGAWGLVDTWDGTWITDEARYNEFKQDINEFKKQFNN